LTREPSTDSPFTRPCMLPVGTAVQDSLMDGQRGEPANAIGTAAVINAKQTPERSNRTEARGRLAAGLGTLTRSLRPSAARLDSCRARAVVHVHAVDVPVRATVSQQIQCFAWWGTLELPDLRDVKMVGELPNLSDGADVWAAAASFLALSASAAQVYQQSR
jgi:hypothetical protein